MNSGSMPGYDLINVIQVTHAADAAREREAAERGVIYPRLVGAGPAQFWFAEYDGQWRIRCIGDADPLDARTNLASHLRRKSEKAPTPEAQAEMLALAARLDPEQEDAEPETGNEWVVAGRRYRIIRGHEFVRWGADGPEPARATDIDPAEKYPERGFVLDPVAPTTPTDAALRLDLVNLVPDPQMVSEQVMADARAALHDYPGIVLLPTYYRAMLEKQNGDWSPIAEGSGPGHARQSLADYFREILPRFPPPDWTPEDIDMAVKTADRLAHETGNQFVVSGRLFRIIRGIRMVRVGPDGPEPARLSDEALPPRWPDDPPYDIH